MVKKIMLICFFIILIVKVTAFVWVYDIILDSEMDIKKLYNENYIDYETYLNLMEIYQDKIDLNRDSFKDLIKIPHLNKELAEKIISKRKKEPFKSIEELLEIDFMDKYRYKRIKPFLKVSINEKFDDQLYIYHYDDKSFLKNKLKFDNFRTFFNIRYDRNIQYYKKNDNYIIDSRKKKIILDSLYFSYQLDKLEISAGDYRLKLGEGLMLSNGSYYGRNELRSNLTRTNYLRGMALKYKAGDFYFYSFYSGYKKEKSINLFNTENNSFEKDTVSDIYWQEAKGVSLQYDRKNLYLGVGFMDYFDKNPGINRSEYFTNFYYMFILNEHIKMFGESLFSNDGLGTLNQLTAEYNNFYFNISYFDRNDNLFLPFFYKSKRDKNNIFTMKIKNRYKNIRFYSKIKSETEDYESEIKYYGKLKYEFNEDIDSFFKYYNNNSETYYSSIGLSIEKNDFEIENEIKQYSDNDLNFEFQLGYEYKFLDVEAGIDYRGEPDDRWKKKVSTGVSADPWENVYFSFYCYKVYGKRSDYYYRIYLRTEI